MKYAFLFLLLGFSMHMNAQKNNIHPNRVYCDSELIVKAILQNDDGSFLCVGATNFELSSGSIHDGLIMRLDANYNMVWKKMYGGSQVDFFSFILKINNNRFLVAGEATSIDGDLAAYSWPFITADNVWLMIIDSNGNFIRGNTYGYGSSTSLSGVELRSDGNIFISGSTVAEGGDFAGNPGDPLVYQSYVALTDTMLNKKWLRYIAGLSSDDNTTGCSTLDKNGNLIIPITSTSVSGDYAGLGTVTGVLDAYVFCVDTNQNILWRRKYEGNGMDAVVDIQSDSINNLYMFARTDSHNGDFFANEAKWNSPMYSTLMKLDSNGTLLWKHSYGSFEDSTLTENRNVQPKGFVLNGDKIWMLSNIQGRDSVGDTGLGWTSQLGANDIWIVQCDSLGVLQNRIRLGGKRYDDAQWITINKQNNNLVVVMNSVGNGFYDNFDCRFNSNSDGKIFEIEQWPTEVSKLVKPLNLIWTISPNPSEGNLLITFEKEFSGELKILDNDSNLLQQFSLKRATQKRVSMSSIASGVYYIEISNEGGRQVKQLMLK